MEAPFVQKYSLVGAPSVEEDCDRFQKALLTMKEYCESNTPTPVLLENVKLLRDALNTKTCPVNFWQPIACGAYKECYHMAGAPEFVIKFASQLNRTQDEIEILQLADCVGLSDLFLPTYFVPLCSTTLPADLLDDEHSDDSSRWITRPGDSEGYTQNPNWVVPELKYIQIQPTISRLSYPKDRMLDPAEYEDCPLLSDAGQPIPWDTVYETTIASRDWLAAVIRCYGSRMVRDLASFIQTNCLYDLHNNNTGYILRNGVEYPVIIDWLSA